MEKHLGLVALIFAGLALGTGALPGSSAAEPRGSGEATNSDGAQGLKKFAGEQSLLQKRLAELIAQLSSLEFSQRAAARAGILALDPGIYPRLREAAAITTDDETRMVLLALSDELEEKKRLAPTLVTFDLKDAELRDFAVELARQAKVPASWYFPDGTGEAFRRSRITIKADREPLWRVLERGSAKVPFSIHYYYQMTAGQRGAVVSSEDGLLALQGADLSRKDRVELAPGGEGKRASGGVLSLRFVTDPHLRTVGAFHTNILPLEDDLGQPIAVQSFGAEMDLQFPAKPGKRLAVLAGDVWTEAVVGTSTFTVPLRKDVRHKSSNGLNYEVTGWEETATRLVLEVHMARPLGPANEAELSVAAEDYVTVDAIGEDGNWRGEFSKEHPMFARDGVVEFEIRKPPVGTIAAARVTVVTRVKPIRLRFELKDLPLP
jgi:hypothetical protein